MTSLQEVIKLPLEFRTNSVSAIMKHIKAGDSCSIVGIGSVGKTNLLRFLMRDDVKRFYLGEETDSIIISYVDCNKLLQLSRWGFLELMLFQLRQSVQKFLMPDSPEENQIKNFYSKIERSKNRKFAFRHVDNAINVVTNQLGKKVVFLIDEFDQVYRNLPKKSFAALRALRDEYKYQLTYIPATRMELNQLRKPQNEIESFAELITPRTIWLGPLSSADAKQTVARIYSRYSGALDEERIQDLLRISGGHPGFLSMVASAIELPSNNLESSLIGQVNVQEECYRILYSLPHEEQQALILLALHGGAKSIPQTVKARLAQKGLLGGEWASEGKIFSSLFSCFLVEQKPVTGRRVRVDTMKRQVWIEGHLASEIDGKEFDLLAFLDMNNGEICRYNEIVRHLYPQDSILEGNLQNDDRLSAVLKRLRKLLRSYIDDTNLIETDRGIGIRLNDKIYENSFDR